jgi:hypothetical protein
VSETEAKRPIIVTAHAVDMYRRRLNDRRPYRIVADEIKECVEEALRTGLIFDQRPPGFALYRSKGAMPPGQRFVQCDTDSRFGFILKRTPDEGDIVVTTLTKAGVRK